MGYHSEPKTPEEIREIFREVQAAKVARAESSHESSGSIGNYKSRFQAESDAFIAAVKEAAIAVASQRGQPTDNWRN